MKGLISLPTHLPVSKVLSLVWCEDVIRKAWHDLLSGEAYSATEDEAAEMLEGECRAGFLQAHSKTGCVTCVFWCGCAVCVDYTAKAKTSFPEVFNGICRCPDVQIVYGEIQFSPCSVLMPCL